LERSANTYSCRYRCAQKLFVFSVRNIFTANERKERETLIEGIKDEVADANVVVAAVDAEEPPQVSVRFRSRQKPCRRIQLLTPMLLK
jgi:hypothetical protein